MNGHAIPYQPKELAWIEARKEMPRRELHALFCARWDRSDVSLDNFKSLCKRLGFMTGRTGRFAPGAAPMNKGKKMPFNANSARTQFKKGQVPHNVKHLGHEHITREGYVEISIAERNPHTGYERRYVHKHRHLWEQLNGPIPEGMRLKCLDGDRTNCDPSNWEAVPMALAPRLNGRFGRGYDSAPAELRPTILLAAKLEHAVREKRKKDVRHG